MTLTGFGPSPEAVRRGRRLRCAQARYPAELAAHEQKLAARQARQDRAEKVNGKAPQAPSP
jgi:hypothetical protein